MTRVGSLCSGYGGIEIGLRMALPAARIAWVAETDPAVSRVLKQQHDAPNLGDITASPWRGAEPIDLLCAGFPCQPVSAAGRQGVEDDHRWLWPDVRRAIFELQPGAVFLENVRNLIAVKYDKSGVRGEVFADILHDLRVLGYRVRWLVVGACTIGAPHHRHRVFLVAGRVPAELPVPPAERVEVLQCGAPRNGGRFLLPTPVAVRYGNNQGGGAGRVSVVPAPLDQVHALLPTPQAHDGRPGSPTLRAETAADRYAAGRRNLEDAAALLPAAHPERWGKYAEAVALWEGMTGRSAPEPAERGPKGSLRLAPELPEWMMGLAPGYLTDELPRLDTLRAAGNGVLPAQAAVAWRLLTT